jgi:hypothetical protein
MIVIILASPVVINKSKDIGADDGVCLFVARQGRATRDDLLFHQQHTKRSLVSPSSMFAFLDDRERSGERLVNYYNIIYIMTTTLLFVRHASIICNNNNNNNKMIFKKVPRSAC